MTFYPFYKALRNASQSMPQGNFGLWYNKFIPLTESDFSPSDERGDKNNNIEHYHRKYSEWAVKSQTLKELIAKKHAAQNGFCVTLPEEQFEIIEIEARLVSPLITGIGESHPHEVSMIFDHNIGIPYIPASGVKGIVRFAHTLSLIDQALENPKVAEQGYFDDEAEWTFVPLMFGTQKVRGKVIFLDAYPKNIPQLHIDIMNPHYGPYYSDGLPPADHHDPKPIKFLTVEAKTSFIFRAIAKKENDLPQKVHTAIVKALTEEGVGAKTAVGYGLFEVDEQSRGVLAQQNNNRQNLGANNDTFALPSAPKPVAATTELWHNATLSWNPGNDELSASFGGNKAIGKGKELLTDSLKAKLKKAKKIVTANVTVEIDGNKIQIIKVEPIE